MLIKISSQNVRNLCRLVYNTMSSYGIELPFIICELQNHRIISMGGSQWQSISCWRWFLRISACMLSCAQLFVTLQDYSVHRLFPARKLEWVAISSFRRSSHLGIVLESLVSPALAGRSI